MPNYHVISKDTVAELKTFPGTESSIVLVLGRITKGDGKGANYYWDAASTDAEDTTYYNTVVVTGVATGRWKRVFTGMQVLPGGILVTAGGKKEYFASGTLNASGEITINLTMENTADGTPIFSDVWMTTGIARVAASTSSDIVTGCEKALAANLKTLTYKFFKPSTSATTILSIQVITNPATNAPAGTAVKIKVEGI